MKPTARIFSAEELERLLTRAREEGADQAYREGRQDERVAQREVLERAREALKEKPFIRLAIALGGLVVGSIGGCVGGYYLSRGEMPQPNNAVEQGFLLIADTQPSRNAYGSFKKDIVLIVSANKYTQEVAPSQGNSASTSETCWVAAGTQLEQGKLHGFKPLPGKTIETMPVENFNLHRPYKVEQKVINSFAEGALFITGKIEDVEEARQRFRDDHYNNGPQELMKIPAEVTSKDGVVKMFLTPCQVDPTKLITSRKDMSSGK